ncbi:DNA-directed RNA polymerases I and III subunit RPAC2-like [Pomacea canaliculata]|uniref:DNA-directed RNA polymerases I and III subunit RPAC2-like n=1 Tax=Pomacea canaliculata TaxID=400727 RepID=UPI000D73571C|nr:DNA-directed RNA polymerases I and III subunit RPAC2-like [Pomacea canaliculata]
MTDKKKPRIEIAPSTDKDDGTWCTFILHDEDHTLGNALRYIIMKNPEVEFCGYSVPHPSENKIHLRIQTRGTSALSVLERGLKDLSALCGHVLKTFEAAVLDYKLHYPVEEMDGDMEGTSS